MNPFSIKSEPILQNEPIRILYPFHSPFTKMQSLPFGRLCIFLFGAGDEEASLFSPGRDKGKFSVFAMQTDGV